MKEQLTEAIEDSSAKKVALSVVLCVLVGVVLDNIVLPPNFKGALAIISPFCYIVYLAYKFQVAITEEKRMTVQEQSSLVQDKVNAENYAEQAMKRNKELSSTLEASKELSDKLGREVEAERKQVTRLTSALSLVKDELHKCNEALDTCQEDLANALTSASEERTRANELAHRCEQLSSNQGTLVSKEVTRLQEQITTQQKTIKDLSTRVKELAPYSAFYKLYESYKASDSQIKSLNRDKALSDEDREDAKQKARIELEKAKEGMISIQESLTN